MTSSLNWNGNNFVEKSYLNDDEFQHLHSLVEFLF